MHFLARPILCLLALVALTATLRAEEPGIIELEERQIDKAVDTVAPSIVRIEAIGGLEKVGDVLFGSGPTTGLIVDPEGYIISSAFNFVQQPNSILVTLPGGKRVAATIVARDKSRMLVLLKVPTTDKLPVPTPVPRREMAPGQWTIAAGRTYEGERPNISVGVLSATNRIWGRAIQSDAKISPSNYGGPLIDLRGRVFGVLVPASPQSHEDLAGAEWYDSGIGFAVPLEDILARLPTLKQGKDVTSGLLGINLKSKNDQIDQPQISNVAANSPAGKAGLKAGDIIVEFDGQKIERQAQFKHALGPHDAGDKVKVVALRGDKKTEYQLELAAKVDPYTHPFLGILPLRDADRAAGGVVVRFVYPGSPAAEAGIQAGDRLTHLAGAAIRDAGSLQETIAAHEVGKTVPVKYVRGGNAAEAQVKLGTLPTDFPPANLPAAHAELKAAERPPVGVVNIKLPEEKNECLAYVPSNYHPDVPHGLVVWLHAPGGYNQEELVARWKALCEKHDLILLAPQSADKAKWDATEVAFVRKTIDDVIKKYNIDRTRVAVHGYQGGGAMAYLVAFGHRDLVRAVAAVDSSLPARAQPPENDPVQRLAVYAAWSEKAKSGAQIEAGAKKFGEAKFPVTTKKLPGEPRYLNAAEVAELARWIDALDRI